ncbi:MAG: family 16 glycoside hydrolase [Verrucomicrobiota bacterium]
MNLKFEIRIPEEERFGNCQLRVVFKCKDAMSNAGVFVRLANGILEQVSQPGAAFDRGAGGRISDASLKKMMESSEREEGPWFAVHRGYEVQIMDASDKFHRTGAIYSLAASSAISQKPPGEWKTLQTSCLGGPFWRGYFFDPTAAPPNRRYTSPPSK